MKALSINISLWAYLLVSASCDKIVRNQEPEQRSEALPPTPLSMLSSNDSVPALIHRQLKSSKRSDSHSSSHKSSKSRLTASSSSVKSSKGSSIQKRQPTSVDEPEDEATPKSKVGIDDPPIPKGKHGIDPSVPYPKGKSGIDFVDDPKSPSVSPKCVDCNDTFYSRADSAVSSNSHEQPGNEKNKQGRIYRGILFVLGLFCFWLVTYKLAASLLDRWHKYKSRRRMMQHHYAYGYAEHRNFPKAYPFVDAMLVDDAELRQHAHTAVSTRAGPFQNSDSATLRDGTAAAESTTSKATLF